METSYNYTPHIPAREQDAASQIASLYREPDTPTDTAQPTSADTPAQAGAPVQVETRVGAVTQDADASAVATSNSSSFATQLQSHLADAAQPRSPSTPPNPNPSFTTETHAMNSNTTSPSASLLFPQTASTVRPFQQRYSEMQQAQREKSNLNPLVTPAPAASTSADSEPVAAASAAVSAFTTIDRSPAQVFAPTPAPEMTQCILPKGLSFKGEAHYPCDVLVEGVFEGKLTAEPNRTITVSETGDLTGDVKATNLRINGKGHGQMVADGGLASFGPKANYSGQITYGRLGIEEGAEVDATMKKITAQAL